MPIDLAEMLDPGHSAVLTMEVQRGVLGGLPALGAAVEEVGILPNLRRLLAGARRAGVAVVHCTAGPLLVPGAPPNYPGAAAMARRGAGVPASGPAALGSTRADLAPEIGPEPSDLVVERHQGVTPFTGTELDGVLRRLGVTTVVASGISLNVGIVALCAEAVSLGYRVAVAVDAVAGVPAAYGRAVLENAIPFLATRLGVDELCAIWEPVAR
ncbi:MAG TPA: isochorismatase family cysteine hydrolase [Acidimicrobiales bacterium]